MAGDQETKIMVTRTADYARARHEGDTGGHDWWHIERVRRLALDLCRQEGGDRLVVELAALLHDVADWKLHGDEAAAAWEVREWLLGLGAHQALVDHVGEIASSVSFLGAGVTTPMRTLEGRIVQDADRLDALGAIGIARAFAYGGARGRALHDLAVPPRRHTTAAAYKASTGPTINQFHEKLLLLKDGLHTVAARRLAAERHQFMEEFLARFAAEWEGRA